MAKKEELKQEQVYFSKETEHLPVNRGELAEVLFQTLQQVDNQLKLSFEHIVEVSNLVDVMTQALVLKGLICEEDLAKAKEALIEATAKLGGETDEEN